ncbi:sensor histidine kinase [Desulfoferrobacter suflitae]|uniref:sensor histidine kinase n=1 Tax=Desulfoferrobacter suflitae TaxID=2865782 RepID=UPI002164A5DD|nr:HAMP domain-containing sensor histidine kinase [Desulfoferrobacter suflitae]MCK8602746.1 HAMP domain-containing histidine kinase [Desulfoferrobacter suflitae]
MDSGMQPAGIALVCDRQGVILKVIRNELNVGGEVKPGQMLIQLVDRGSIGKALNFLVELKANEATFDWQINVAVGGKVTTLHFGGAVVEGLLLIFASQTRNGVLELYEELVRINNEQVNALRLALKDKARKFKTRSEQDGSLYDELSRLNNELVTLQRELAKKNVELERLNSLKNQFLGMAAHDLRTPLGHILAYSEFLIDEAGPSLSEEHLEFLSIIRSSSDFMLQLVSDLLDYTRIESGKLKLDRRPTDLVALVERNIALNRVLAAPKQIQLRFAYSGERLPILIDSGRMEQVLNNLIGNAVKFSAPHGTVDVYLEKDDDQVLIKVQDHGSGIAPNELERLFNPFSKSVKGTSGEKGSGLGLAIVKKIVEEHQGKVWVESKLGEGSTFFVALPVGPANPPEEEESVSRRLQIKN